MTVLLSKEHRPSLEYADYDTNAPKDRMESVFSDKIQSPFDEASFNVGVSNISIKNGSSAQVIAHAVSMALESNPYSSFLGLEKIGCEWKVVLPKNKKSNLNKKETKEQDNFWMHAIILDRGDKLDETFAVELCLIAPKRTSASFLRIFNNTKNERMAIAMFDYMCCMVQKELSRLEFPSFPEGNSDKTFRSCYQLNEKLNEGAFGVVFKGRHRETDKVVAVKSVNRKNLSARDEADIFSEVALMANIDHPHIVKVIDFFEERGHFLMVLEYLEGGDMHDHIKKKKLYNEEEAKQFCKILVETIHYCHSKSIAHLDLKSDNLVLSRSGDEASVKLIDFGFAQRVSGRNCLARRCGTPYFIAPEIIEERMYDERADNWSMGVLMYLFLSGCLPFTGENKKEVFEKISSGKVEFNDSNWANVSQEAKDLVNNLLDTNPDTRWTAKSALSSSWFNNQCESTISDNNNRAECKVIYSLAA